MGGVSQNTPSMVTDLQIYIALALPDSSGKLTAKIISKFIRMDAFNTWESAWTQ